MNENDNIRVESIKEQFISIYNNNIHREGADKLLDFLQKTEFFNMPASTRFHLSRPGGLAEHSIDTYIRLSQLYILYKTQPVPDMPPEEPCDLTAEEKETIAIVGLLHDLCKYDCYEAVLKSRKTGRLLGNGKPEWEDYMGYGPAEDAMPYGHGEESVYIIQSFMKLKREEAMAIRWHMGFSDVSFPRERTVGKAFDRYPLAVLAHMADLFASHIDETKPEKKIGGANA